MATLQELEALEDDIRRYAAEIVKGAASAAPVVHASDLTTRLRRVSRQLLKEQLFEDLDRAMRAGPRGVRDMVTRHAQLLDRVR